MNNVIKVTEYDEFREKLEVVRDSCNFLPDVTTDEGYAKSKRVALDVGKVLTSLEARRKELKSEYLEKGRMVDSEAKGIAETLADFQLPHKEAYKELDNLKKQREQERKDRLEERVRVIRELPDSMRDSDSEGIKMALDSLLVEECEDFYEYTQQALLARNASKEALSTMFAAALNREKEAAELEKLRKESAEREKKDREDRIAKEAADKATQEAEAKAEVRTEKAAEDARLAEVARVVQETEQLRIAAETRKANKRHVGKIRGEAKHAIMALGIAEKDAKAIVLAIHNNAVPNVSIKY